MNDHKTDPSKKNMPGLWLEGQGLIEDAEIQEFILEQDDSLREQFQVLQSQIDGRVNIVENFGVKLGLFSLGIYFFSILFLILLIWLLVWM